MDNFHGVRRMPSVDPPSAPRRSAEHPPFW